MNLIFRISLGVCIRGIRVIHIAGDPHRAVERPGIVEDPVALRDELLLLRKGATTAFPLPVAGASCAAEEDV